MAEKRPTAAQVEAQTAATREASANAAQLADATERLIGVVAERARHEGGIAGAEQAAEQIAEVALAADDAVEVAKDRIKALTQRALLRTLAGMAVFVAVGLSTPPQSTLRWVFVAVSVGVAVGLLVRAR